jgi:hypothetical protein
MKVIKKIWLSLLTKNPITNYYFLALSCRNWSLNYSVLVSFRKWDLEIGENISLCAIFRHLSRSPLNFPQGTHYNSWNYTRSILCAFTISIRSCTTYVVHWLKACSKAACSLIRRLRCMPIRCWTEWKSDVQGQTFFLERRYAILYTDM